jgi:hypothetical protein
MGKGDGQLMELLILDSELKGLDKKRIGKPVAWPKNIMLLLIVSPFVIVAIQVCLLLELGERAIQKKASGAPFVNHSSSRVDVRGHAQTTWLLRFRFSLSLYGPFAARSSPCV